MEMSQNHLSLTDYRIANGVINLYRGTQLYHSIDFADFADFMDWSLWEATDRLTEPDEDMAYYLDKMSQYLSLQMEIENPGPYDLPPLYPII